MGNVMKHYEAMYKVSLCEGGIRIRFEPRLVGSYFKTADPCKQAAIERSMYFKLGQIYIANEELLDDEGSIEGSRVLPAVGTSVLTEVISSERPGSEDVSAMVVGSVDGSAAIDLRFLEDVTNVTLAKEWLTEQGVAVSTLKNKAMVVEAGERMGVKFNLK